MAQKSLIEMYYDTAGKGRGSTWVKGTDIEKWEQQEC